ncbi:hypothetical protein [Microbacterium sp. 8M]|uniref:hypothetical protein n=1 Tax=Microbacterium sp. 8M TaxID=2653153 RepID=UPI001359B5FE|nr:hypothetical protein [Microbacterium sp. 8M]
MMDEQDGARSRPSNIQHGQKRQRPVSHSAILIAFSALVLALAVVVDGVWQMVAG